MRLLLQAGFVIAAVVVLVYALGQLRHRTPGRRRPAVAVPGGRWETHHHDVRGVTRVVVRRVSPNGTNILDEHQVAEIPTDAPDYDTRFMTAMATARERVALFEAEQG